MLEIIRLNFVEMIHNYDQYQKTKRIQALKTTKAHLAGRFIKLYRAFRHKKYGEEDPFKEEEKEIEFPPHLMHQENIIH